MKAMNNVAHSRAQPNWRPLRRLLWIFPVCLVVHWAFLRSANAQQLYVDGEFGGVGVGNASLEGAFSFNFIRVAGYPSGNLAISGNTLFVLQGTVPSSSVVTFDATTGAVINAKFITISGGVEIAGLAVSGNTLFLALGNGFIGTYNLTTGAAINAKLITLPSDPLSIAVSGNALFVAMKNRFVGSYNATTGAVINDRLIATAGSGITAQEIAVSGNTLFLGNVASVGKYNATTGVAINASFITGVGPFAITISGNTLFVAGLNSITSYDATTGALMKSITYAGTLTAATGLAVGSGASADPNIMNFGTVPVWQIETVGDFNGDGHPDLVFANTTYPTPGNSIQRLYGDVRDVWFLLNNGVVSFANGTFPVAPFHIPGPPWRIAGSGDFNGDGSTDLVWENTSTGQHAIWLIRDLDFANAITLPTVAPPWRVAGVGDFNHDGNADLVWENTSTGQRAIWLLVNGVFSSSIALPTVGPQWRIAEVGDFDNDGNPDLVWENTITGAHAIWFLKNGVFSSSITLPTVATAWHVAGVGDFNGDGNADIILQNTSTGQIIAWMLKNGAFLYQ